jgi:hypothetical protein
MIISFYTVENMPSLEMSWMVSLIFPFNCPSRITKAQEDNSDVRGSLTRGQRVQVLLKGTHMYINI